MRNTIDINALPLNSPCYAIKEELLIKNLETLHSIEQRTGCKILLAQKAFSMFSAYPLIGQYISGTAASGLFEAKLGHEEMPGKEVHVFSPAYTDAEFEEILQICDHIVFNSFAQWKRFRPLVKNSKRKVQCGIRINPEYTEQEHGIYDPCAPFSRLGVTEANFEENELCFLSGLHFHTLCEQNADALEHTLEVIQKKFGKYLYGLKWLNLGGGHHITRSDYDVERLIRCIDHMQNKYDIQIYLEPGEAVALNVGYLVSTVLDTLHNGIDIAILDTSAACHMPDVLEMPYRPHILGAGLANEKAFPYRLGGPTCLAGDIIGDYSFDEPLKAGDKLIFCDMAIYTMVKNNTFNGMKLPSIVVITKENEVKIIREFGYNDFKMRLS